MSKDRQRRLLDDYTLFYEEIGAHHSQSEATASPTKPAEKKLSLNEQQLAKLGNDLRNPIKNTARDNQPQ